MSVCFFLASDYAMPEYSPSRKYPVKIDVDKGVIDDGGADDNFSLFRFDGVQNYSEKKYAVQLEWNYTDGRAGYLLDYIGKILENTDVVELWYVWLAFFYDYEESPVVKKYSIKFNDMTVNDIKNFYGSEIWNQPDKYHPQRPSFYCLTIFK